ncbi:6-phospho-beta-glucosidase [Entomoplasma freundtii]|uniref:6-phospho-beta-glucosidase n=1 Tax=Entomoplasma freundtii TaxID=74700 RepID=A0A2K8NQI4_9MOLU|nr:glycoside hydrolase family 1 protein [Entomoplasma freundtii]ATZ16054.1 6-phospho-beta-glucosidase [Entomoplasma freundtii]TDY58077.1 6-phospho-beta-glucosidase [Entomoplasma freundtii]
MKIQFNPDFWWGTATSGPQSEGNFGKKQMSIMDYWFENKPEDFFNQVGPTITTAVYKHYSKDIELMKGLKHNSFRTSIQWTRLIADLETNKPDPEAIAFYRSYFEKLKTSHIKVVVNLFHFDMPIAFQNIGGFENPKVIDHFVAYAKICFQEFGDVVDYWITFNEPIVPIEACYLYKLYWPKICDFKRAIQAAWGTLVAHAKVVNAFHLLFQSDPHKQIGVVLNLTPAYPKSDNQADVQAAQRRDLMFNRFFLDGTVKGTISPELVDLLEAEGHLPKVQPNDLKQIAEAKIDFLGVNYYQPARIQAPTEIFEGPLMPEKWFANYEWPERRINPHRGWEIHPKTLYNIAMDLKENYNNIPWFVSENGMGVSDEGRFRNESGQIQDDYRIDFIKEHLYWLHLAIKDGANCFGYHLWTFIDCWSWANAFKNRYGLVELDLETQNRRTKKSGEWLRNVIENNNQIEIDTALIQ